MQLLQLLLPVKSIADVKHLVQTLTMFDGEVEMIGGKYIVDAKSILGLFSVDLSKPVTLRIEVTDSKLDDILNAISKYREK